MLSVQLVGDKELIARLQSMPEAIQRALVRKATTLAIALQRYIRTDKLSGQVLNKRTGALQSSIFYDVEADNTSVVATVSAGKDVPYAAIHEYGGVIKHPGGTAYLIDKTTGMAKFISNKASIADKLPRTKPHNIPMPERSFMRTGLGDMKVQIIEGLTEAVKEGMNANAKSL